jgi:hypothetical protein
MSPSGLTFLDSRLSNNGRPLVSQRTKRAPHAAINGFKHLINNRGTVARDAVKKIVSSLRGARLNPQSRLKARLHRAGKSG